MNISTFIASLLGPVAICSASHGASISYSFWAYDQAAGSTFYYSHFQIGTTTDGVNPMLADPSIALIDLNHGNPSVYTTIESGTPQASASRSVGWHRYEFNFDANTSTATILLDDTPIHSAAYAQTPGFFRFVFHDHLGGSQESVIDDFEYRVDGVLVYQNGFEAGSLDSNWVISRQDAGTYVTSGDTSLAHSGFGGLALGDTNSNNNAVIVSFVPEPSTALLVFGGLSTVLLRRRHPKNSRG